MEPISGVERLAELLRKRATEKVGGTEKPATSVSTPQENRGRLTVAALEQQIHHSVKQLLQANATPETLQRVIIESILVWEYSEALHNEPKFSALVNRVQQHIESEADLKAIFEKIIKQFTQ